MSRDPVVMQALAGGCDGVPHAARLTSGAPGPHVLVNAMSHGNEPCGLAALRLILDNAGALCRGSVTLVLANPAAALAPGTGGGNVRGGDDPCRSDPSGPRAVAAVRSVPLQPADGAGDPGDLPGIQELTGAVDPSRSLDGHAGGCGEVRRCIPQRIDGSTDAARGF